MNFLTHAKQEYAASKRRKARDAKPMSAPVQATINKQPKPPAGGTGPELPRENGLGGGFQVVIQTPQFKGENVLQKDGLLRHVNLMEEISQYKVDMYGS